jgi:hypothetical protein
MKAQQRYGDHGPEEVHLGFTMPRELHDRLESCAIDLGLSPSALAARIVAENLDRYQPAGEKEPGQPASQFVGPATRSRPAAARPPRPQR